MARMDLLDLVQNQRSERYRALIIHAGPLAGKTRTARRLVERLPDAVYVDFLAEFLEHPDWNAAIDRFRLHDLAAHLLALGSPGQVVVVDHLDFLLDTWPVSQRQAFAQWADEKLDGFAVTDKVFIFFIQTDADIVNYPMRRRNRLGQARIYRLAEFNAL